MIKKIGIIKGGASVASSALLQYWDYDHNNCNPDTVGLASNYKVWWVCPDCGKSYQRSPNSQSKSKHLCFDCSVKSRADTRARTSVVESFQDRFPELVSAFMVEKNGVLPSEIAFSSSRKYWFKCPECGCEFEKRPTSISSMGSWCPQCAKKNRTKKHLVNALKKDGCFLEVAPHLIDEWDGDRNKGIDPHSLLKGSEVKVWWKCKYHNSYFMSIKNRTLRHLGCPKCNECRTTSFPEKVLKYYLEKVTTVDVQKKIGRMRLDLFLPDFNVAIEYDGAFYHDTDYGKDRDERKDNLCKEMSIDVIHIKEKDYKTDDFSQMIEDICNKLSLPVPDVNIERDRSLISSESNHAHLPNSLGDSLPASILYWDAKRNGNVTPYHIGRFSNVPRWFVCPVCHKSFLKTPQQIAHNLVCKDCARTKESKKYRF